MLETLLSALFGFVAGFFLHAYYLDDSLESEKYPKPIPSIHIHLQQGKVIVLNDPMTAQYFVAAENSSGKYLIFSVRSLEEAIKIGKCIGKVRIIYEKKEDNSLKEVSRAKSLNYLAINGIQRKCLPILREILMPTPKVLAEFESLKGLSIEEVRSMILENDKDRKFMIDFKHEKCVSSGTIKNRWATIQILKIMHIKNNVLHCVVGSTIKAMGMKGEAKTTLQIEVDERIIRVRQESKVLKKLIGLNEKKLTKIALEEVQNLWIKKHGFKQIQ